MCYKGGDVRQYYAQRLTTLHLPTSPGAIASCKKYSDDFCFQGAVVQQVQRL
jgi:hypothetical protein